MNKTAIFFCLICFTPLFGHEEGHLQSWEQWLGSFHLIFLHFPIALITMTLISELLFTRYKSPIFEFSSRFMLIAAAILAAPTALLGLIYSDTMTYEGLLADFIWWHMWFGFSTAIFSIYVACLREFYGKSKWYYTCLVILFFMVTVTGFLGGGVTFGSYPMFLPL